MTPTDTPIIPAEKKLPGITLKVIVISVFLSMILAVANAYLALKIGILTSASIPAAVMAIGILRFFKKSNLLEINLIQTAASAGEAIAGGIVYTVPALVILQFWTGFDYWQNVAISLIGGILGVMFSIPLRHLLVKNKQLAFPEAKAIAEVIKITHVENLGIKDILFGSIIGAVIEFFQSGVKLLADSATYYFKINNTFIGFGLGFSPAMIGAGYLIGINIALSIFIGAIISWVFCIAGFSTFMPNLISPANSITEAATTLWSHHIRFVGIGAMLVAGIITLSTLLIPLMMSFKLSWRMFRDLSKSSHPIRTEFDLPTRYVVMLSIALFIGLYFLYLWLFPFNQLGIDTTSQTVTLLTLLLYTIIAGFIFGIIAAYFSGMVGVSASPGSSIAIAALMLGAILVFFLAKQSGIVEFSNAQVQAAAAIAIICTSIIMGMAAIANDNMQDLKVGHIVGSTPWKQQVMLIIGVISAATVIPLVMQVLYNVYGIANVMPRPNMDPTLSLPAPPAAAMAMLSGVFFQNEVPWNMLALGGSIIVLIKIIHYFSRKWQLSLLGVAIGMYLPLTSSMPIFLGGVIAYLTTKKNKVSHRDMTLACGLIAGSALLDVLLAIPFALMHDPNALSLAPANWQAIGFLLNIIVTVGLFIWLKKLVSR